MFREAHKEIQCRQWVVGNFPLCHYTRRITLWTAAGVNIVAKYCQYITWSPITSEKWFPSAVCFPNWVYNTDCVRWESNPQPFSCFYFLHNLIYFLQRCQTSLNIQRDGLLMKVTRRYKVISDWRSDWCDMWRDPSQSGTCSLIRHFIWIWMETLGLMRWEQAVIGAHSGTWRL